eukprot:9467165-Pyramimonas_sp.AAC.1
MIDSAKAQLHVPAPGQPTLVPVLLVKHLLVNCHLQHKYRDAIGGNEKNPDGGDHKPYQLV